MKRLTLLAILSIAVATTIEEEFTSSDLVYEWIDTNGRVHRSLTEPKIISKFDYLQWFKSSDGFDIEKPAMDAPWGQQPMQDLDQNLEATGELLPSFAEYHMKHFFLTKILRNQRTTPPQTALSH